MRPTDRPLEIRALLDGGCVALDLRRAARRITRRYERALRPVRLTSFQFSALHALEAGGPLRQSALAQRLAMDLSTLNRNLRPMIERDLVEVTTETQDRRARRVSLTAEGRATFESALPLWAEAQRETVAAFGERVWPMLRATLATIEETPPSAGRPPDRP